jgi:hypothetical protein
MRPPTKRPDEARLPACGPARRDWLIRLAAAPLLGWAATAPRAEPLQLVTADEVARDAAAAPPRLTPRAAPVPDAPRIRVLAPTLAGAPLGNPIRIDLAFSAAADAEIDPASFRIQYGVLRIDLTERVLARVTVQKTGLKVDDVVIPPGQHRLLLRIADSKARVGEAELRFTVQ